MCKKLRNFFLSQIYEELERKCVRGSEKKLKPEYVSLPGQAKGPDTLSHFPPFFIAYLSNLIENTVSLNIVCATKNRQKICNRAFGTLILSRVHACKFAVNSAAELKNNFFVRIKYLPLHNLRLIML